MTDSTEPEGSEFARGATTIMEVLNRARKSGFGGSFNVISADAVRCLECGCSSLARLWGSLGFIGWKVRQMLSTS